MHLRFRIKHAFINNIDNLRHFRLGYAPSKAARNLFFNQTRKACGTRHIGPFTDIDKIVSGRICKTQTINSSNVIWYKTRLNCFVQQSAICSGVVPQPPTIFNNQTQQTL